MALDQKKEVQNSLVHRSVKLIYRLFQDPMGAVGLLIVISFLIIAIFADFIAPYDPSKINILNKLQGPSADHLFGTDQLGRDTFARMLAGGRTSIAVGLCAMGLTIFLGTFIGVTAGFYKRLDGPLMRLTDLFLSLPLLPLLLVMMLLFREPLSSAYGPERGMFILIVFAIGITSWMPTARIVRADVLALKEREFVLAAIASGSSNSLVVRRHILPNVL